MPNFLTVTLLLVLACLSAGCSTLEFPGVYKLTIEQGNVITQEMIDQLKPGMSREQVEFVMGHAQIKDTFSSDRWDYVYRIQRGDEPAELYRMTVFFEGDRLHHFTGDFVPSSARQTDS